MKFSMAVLASLVSMSAFAAPTRCPIAAAVDAAQNEFAAENFGEQGAERAAQFAGVTSNGKQVFYVTIDGTDNGNSIAKFVVYLAPGSCRATDRPVAIRN